MLCGTELKITDILKFNDQYIYLIVKVKSPNIIHTLPATGEEYFVIERKLECVAKLVQYSAKFQTLSYIYRE